jgi:hypothetical protein
MPLQDYQLYELKPRKLSKEETENPMQVVHDFFSYGHIPEIREQLWELLFATVTGNFCKMLSRQERSNMVYFYTRLEKVIEAVHIIHSNIEVKEAEK